MLYHPDLAIVFASVFCEFLMIPVGMIFGARNSPAWWCIPAELRAHLGATKDYSDAGPLPLADSVKLSDPPSEAEIARFVQAVPDAIHQGVPDAYQARLNHVMFVDDNVSIEIRQRIRAGIRSAVGSAYDSWGHPDSDRRGSCLQAAKFPASASHELIHLGYLFDSRRMRVEWPADKRATLRAIVDDWLGHRIARTPIEIATVLGLIRHGAFLCPLGAFLSIRLQLTLSTAIIAGGPRALSSKPWWKRHRINIPTDLYASDIAMLALSLQPGAVPAGEPSVWSRPIALLVQREWTCQVLSDAAYSGIGGWSPTFQFMWRITRAELVAVGFNMKAIGADSEAARIASTDGSLHINVLEFVGIIINIWFTIIYTRRDPTKPGGHVVSVTADNTSALSWFRHASRSHRPTVRNLAFLCQCLIIFSQTSDFTNFEGSHIPGTKNCEADALSRPELFPTVGCAIERFSQLRTCRAFLLPFGLLSTIASAISSPAIEASFVNRTITLLTLEPISSPVGADGMPLTMGFYKRSHRGKRSR